MERVLSLQGLSASLRDGGDVEPIKPASGDSGICSTASTGWAVSTCSLICNANAEMEW